MQLPALAIRNHQFTAVMFLLLVLLGVVSFFTMGWPHLLQSYASSDRDAISIGSESGLCTGTG